MTTYDEFVATLDFSPTPEQEEVIRSTDQAIAVIAGAGSGKTETMTQRIVWNVINGTVRPDQVLGLTFTNKAAGELAERVDKQLRYARAQGLMVSPEGVVGNESLDREPEPLKSGVDDEASLVAVGDENLVGVDAEAAATHAELAKPTIATYNSFASEIASSYAMLIGEDPRARLITDAERYQIMTAIVEDIDDSTPELKALSEERPSTIVADALHLTDEIVGNSVSTKELREYLRTERDAISRAREVRPPHGTAGGIKTVSDCTLASIYALNVRIALSYVVELYLAYKKEHSLIEFSDQVVRARKILTAVPEVAEELRRTYKLILLDEYQDTSTSQAAFLETAFRQADSVCAVGDPNQAIYSWRGASSAALSEFMDRFGVAKNLTLSTAFRNSPEILDAANALTIGKLSYPGMTVKKLSSIGTHDGRAILVHRRFREDAYRDMVRYIADEFDKARLDGANELPTAAILCRARSYMEHAIKALEEFEVPYEVVGGESLINKPELRLVRSLLGLAVNPARNDLLVPLFNFFALGAKDVHALAQTAKYLADEVTKDLDGHTDASTRVDANLVEALVALARKDVPEPADMTVDGVVRFSHIGSLIGFVTNSRHLPIPEVITTAIDALDLRSYAQSRLSGGARVEAALGHFVQLGVQFSSDNPGGSLRDFVTWVDALEDHENVGEGDSAGDLQLLAEEDIEPEVGVVQLLTIHAAKGLEWDIVGVPDMKLGGFDEKSRATPWYRSKEDLPYPLRDDREHLPQFEFQKRAPIDQELTREGKLALFEEFLDFVKGEFKDHHAKEQRRLAYVAVTRPKRLLIVSSYDIKDETDTYTPIKLLKEHVNSLTETVSLDEATLPRNTFVSDMLDVVEESASNDPPITGAELIAMDAVKGDVEVDQSSIRYWPADMDRRLDFVEIPQRSPSDSERDALIDRWNLEAAAIISERHAKIDTDPVTRDYLTASDVVFLARDPGKFLVEQRRPIPGQPSRAARTGTLVHAEIAHHYNAPSTLDVDAVAHPDEMPLDTDLRMTDARHAELLRRFDASEYSNCPPLAIEEAIDVRVDGRPIRCVIDAVLDTSSLAGYPPVTIVDWKTGRRPTDAEVMSRELQLGLYRLAWARSRGADVGDVGACFYFLGEEDEARRELRAGDLSEEDIAALIREQLEKGATAIT